MPGGRRDFYDRIEATLQAVSAKVNGEPCVAYMGAGSAGHFVKMVHNGIEYGLMQILAETYDFMQRVLKMDHAAMSDAFAEWNGRELNSFLVEITAEVVRKTDAETGKPLVSMILDTAGQKARQMDISGSDGFWHTYPDNRLCRFHAPDLIPKSDAWYDRGQI
jgi:6-phosphogluconate dehydrogenase